MFINVVQEEESRVAIVADGVLQYFEIETLSSESLKGNIYKGVVENVNSSLEAAFVNCGWDRPGFLPLDEVNFRVLPSIKGRKGGSKIVEHVAPGMEFLVQVSRDRFNSKPPSLTTYYSLPGRYLVLAPFSDGSGVSRRIEDEDERAKLRKMIEDLHPPEGFGVIVRTAGLDQNRSELVRDMGYLLHLWETVERAATVARAPSLIYRERDLALRTIRDQMSDDIAEVLIDDPDVYENALRFVRAVAPHREPAIKLYTGDKPVFTRFNLEEQIETIYKRRVPLKSGGEIVIEETEALTAIDVNSSRSRESSAEETALRTNLEAATEITRQLRLRDLGGLIVIDFIDMEAPKHARAVEKAVREGMRPDKAKYDATKISKLGIMEISRQRLKAAKAQATYITCPVCDGAGTVRTTEAAALAALRRIQTRVVRGDIATLRATLPSEVALYLLNQKREEILDLEHRYLVRINLVPQADLAKERCDIETTARDGAPPWVLPQQPRAKTPRRDEREPAAHAAQAKAPELRSEPGPEDLDRGAHAGGRVPEAAREAPPSDEPAAPAPIAAAPESMMGAGEAQAVSPIEFAPQTIDETEEDVSEDAGETAVYEAEAAEGEYLEPTDAIVAAEPEETAVPSAGDALTAAGRKRRRKRGGRGRKRPAAAPGAAPVARPAAAPVVQEREDEEPEGKIIWEDAEEEAGSGPMTMAPHVEGEHPAASAEPAGAAGADESGAGTGKKRRRRRRGGRGRKRLNPGDAGGALQGEDAEDGGAGSEDESDEFEAPAADSRAKTRGPALEKKPGASPPASRGSQPGEPRVEKRRRRGPRRPEKVAGPRAAEPRGEITGAGKGAGAPVAVGAGHERPPAEGADEDIPGGWWSRLRGAKKRGGRED